MGVIYKTINIQNKKIYIGQTIKNLNEFYESNYFGSGYLLHKFIKKYGINFFIRGVIEEVKDEELNKRERFWIDYYQSMNRKIGYNLTSGGESEKGFKHSPETKLKIGISNKKHTGRKLSDETKQKLSIAAKGKKLSEDTKQKISNSKKGVKQSEEHRKNNALSKLGFKHSQESKIKVSETLKERYKQNSVSDEIKRKISQKTKERMSVLENRQKISNTLKGHSVSEETRKKISESIKKYYENKKISNNTESFECKETS